MGTPGASDEKASLLHGEAVETKPPWATVSRVSLLVGALAVVAFAGVFVVSTGVISTPGAMDSGIDTDMRRDGAAGGDGKLDDALTRHLMKDVQALSSKLGLTDECRTSVIDHQRTFVNRLESFFANGCGGPKFEPLAVRDEILQEQDLGGNGNGTNVPCDQATMDSVFVRTFARVYDYMCVSDEKTLNVVMGFRTTNHKKAAAISKSERDTIALALSATEGLETMQVSVVDVIDVAVARASQPYKKFFEKDLKTANGQEPDVVFVVQVSAGDMAESLLSVTHFSHAAENGLLTGQVEKEGVAYLQGAVVLGWLPPKDYDNYLKKHVPEHYLRFKEQVKTASSA